MTFVKEPKNLLAKFEKYKVRFKDGFFHMYNLAASPETMIEGFNKLPFMKHDRINRVVSYESLFLSGQFYYIELETGLWLILQELVCKQNVVIHNVFDSSLPPEFNLINLHSNRKTLDNKSMLINGLVLSDKTWSFFKPAKIKDHYHFKGSHEFNCTLFFTDDWFTKHIQSKSEHIVANLNRFFKSDNSYIFLDDTGKANDQLYDDFLTLMRDNVDNSKIDQIRNLVDSFFTRFTTLYSKETMDESYFKISDKDRKYVQKAVNFLLSNLLNDFPGIEAVSKKVGISPTKLKNDFKIIHKKGLFQYFRFHQMQLAEKLLTEKAKTVKEVATIMGYKNGSKFSTAFKNQFGVLPSNLINNIN